MEIIRRIGSIIFFAAVAAAVILYIRYRIIPWIFRKPDE